VIRGDIDRRHVASIGASPMVDGRGRRDPGVVGRWRAARWQRPRRPRCPPSAHELAPLRVPGPSGRPSRRISKWRCGPVELTALDDLAALHGLASLTATGADEVDAALEVVTGPVAKEVALGRSEVAHEGAGGSFRFFLLR
jgi:hypothetical protein